MKRRISCTCLAIGIFIVFSLALRPVSLIGAASKTVTITLNVGSQRMEMDGAVQLLDAAPVILEDRTVLPVRPIVEAIGGTIEWDATSRKVSIVCHTRTLELWIAKSEAIVDGVTRQIDLANPRVVPVIISGRTMLPIRFVATSLGGTVDWNATLKRITLVFPITVTSTIPVAPTLSMPAEGEAVESLTPRLSWSFVSGASRYRIVLRADDQSVVLDREAQAVSELVVPQGLLAYGRTYTWTVSAGSEDSWGNESDSRSFRTPSLPATLQAPELLTPASNMILDTDEVTLTWKPSTGATSYSLQMERREKFGLVYLPTGEKYTKEGIATTSYTVPKGILANGRYLWSVAACNDAGCSAMSSSSSMVVRRPWSVSEVANLADRVVLIETEERDMFGAVAKSGSGFLISASGWIVTNYHVIDKALAGTITLNDGREITDFVVIGYDVEKDLAIIDVPGDGYPFCKLGDSAAVGLGDGVVAIGSPLGLQNTVSEGIVSRIWADGIQTTAAISPGSSGGALFNLFGEVVGVTTAGMQSGENIGWAIPSNEIGNVSTSGSWSLRQVYESEHGDILAPTWRQSASFVLVNMGPDYTAAPGLDDGIMVATRTEPNQPSKWRLTWWTTGSYTKGAPASILITDNHVRTLVSRQVVGADGGTVEFEYKTGCLRSPLFVILKNCGIGGTVDQYYGVEDVPSQRDAKSELGRFQSQVSSGTVQFTLIGEGIPSGSWSTDWDASIFSDGRVTLELADELLWLGFVPYQSEKGTRVGASVGGMTAKMKLVGTGSFLVFASFYQLLE
ncbi:trypsin-like peptidase domain-containing protein [Candidatus Cryosericum terrychapinii]|nr:trypsin-like peptidase domain-containing protein [Candidatus Cryosericum terrychapinii]